MWEIKNCYALTTEEAQIKHAYANEYINNSEKFDLFYVATEKDIDMNVNVLLRDVVDRVVIIDANKIKRFYNRIGKANESYIKEKIVCLEASIRPLD